MNSLLLTSVLTNVLLTIVYVVILLIRDSMGFNYCMRGSVERLIQHNIIVMKNIGQEAPLMLYGLTQK